MVRNNFLFFISGLFSLLLFFILLGVVVYVIFLNNNKPTFALKKDTAITISLSMVDTVKQKDIKSVQKAEPKTEPKREKIVKEERSDVITPQKDVVQKDIAIKDLFSNVWTKEISKKAKKKKTKIDKHRLLDITKEIKPLVTKRKSSISDVVKSIDANVSNENKTVSKGESVNEYLAKINAIVYKYFNPPANSGGNSVKARIDLSAMGKVLDFRILNYSSNKYLNEECDKIKDRLQYVMFPVNPEHKSSVTLVILTSKE